VEVIAVNRTDSSTWMYFEYVHVITCWYLPLGRGQKWWEAKSYVNLATFVYLRQQTDRKRKRKQITQHERWRDIRKWRAKEPAVRVCGTQKNHCYYNPSTSHMSIYYVEWA